MNGVSKSLKKLSLEKLSLKKLSLKKLSLKKLSLKFVLILLALSLCLITIWFLVFPLVLFSPALFLILLELSLKLIWFPVPFRFLVTLVHFLFKLKILEPPDTVILSIKQFGSFPSIWFLNPIIIKLLIWTFWI